MFKQHIICATEKYVQKSLQNDSAHDWWHIFRVRQLAKYIGAKEKANLFIIEMAALLHDLDDWKFQSQKQSLVKMWLQQTNIEQQSAEHILEIVDNISFKGANVSSYVLSLEGKIVQDADRLDAIGAIGIARTFAYGGFKERELYNPNIIPQLHNSFDEYKKSNSTTVNHFYEKLFLIKDKLNTATGKLIAHERHEFMEKFLKQFFNEWNCYNEPSQ